MSRFKTERYFDVIHIHGTADEEVPYNGGSYWSSVDELINYTKNFNACLDFEENDISEYLEGNSLSIIQTTYTECLDNTKVRLIKVENGGHDWFVWANYQIWSFFNN